MIVEESLWSVRANCVNSAYFFKLFSRPVESTSKTEIKKENIKEEAKETPKDDKDKKPEKKETKSNIESAFAKTKIKKSPEKGIVNLYSR